MPDNLKERGSADRNRINIHERWEVEYWTKELGVTEARLRQMVAAHGDSAAAVRRALGK